MLTLKASRPKGVLWAAPTAQAPEWAGWQADITTINDGWGAQVDTEAYPGFQQDEGDSSDGTSSMTSSDSDNEVLDTDSDENQTNSSVQKMNKIKFGNDLRMIAQ